MEQKFEKTVLSCLDTVLQEVQNTELTQQLQLPDALPDIGRVICGWGQCILRGKEWLSDRVSLSAGMMVWILYALEDGSQERWIDTWIPFQMRWDLPDDTPEGQLRVACTTRFIDARSISPRKIMVRAGAAARVEAWSPVRTEVSTPGSSVEKVELLERAYPLRLRREAGEKAFALEEELTLPDHMPKADKLLCCQLTPRIVEKKVLTDKIVFRGSLDAHIIYQGEDGKLHSWDSPMSFSQFEELEQEHSTDAGVDLLLAVTAAEMEMDDDGVIRMETRVTAQYCVCDRVLLNLVEDAFSPTVEVELQLGQLKLPVILDQSRQTLQAQARLNAPAQIVELQFLPDMPRQRPQNGAAEVELMGTFRMLGYGENGALEASAVRWEDQIRVDGDENSVVDVMQQLQPPQWMEGRASAELAMELTSSAHQSLPMVTELKQTGQKTMDPNRPSLILGRCGELGLWELARKTGSTAASIRRANGLEGEPDPNRLLLIPVI